MLSNFNDFVNRTLIKKIVANKEKKTTVVWFYNGSKAILKCAKGVKYDIHSAVAYALTEMLFGSNSAFKKYVNAHTHEV